MCSKRLVEDVSFYRLILYFLDRAILYYRAKTAKNHKRWYCPSSHHPMSMCCWIISFVIRLVEMRGCHWFKSRHVV